MSREMLVDAPTGEQQVIKLQDGGGYFDKSRILWDTANDGSIPDGITLGGMVRQGNALIFSQARMDLAEAAIKPQKIAQAHAEFEQEMSAIRNQYPDSERAGWPQQQMEAERLLADPLAPAPILDAMTGVTGEDKQTIAQAIIAKVTLYSKVYGEALGRKRKKIDAIG